MEPPATLALAPAPSLLRGHHALTAASLSGTLLLDVAGTHRLVRLAVRLVGTATILPHPVHAVVGSGAATADILCDLSDVIYDARIAEMEAATRRMALGSDADSAPDDDDGPPEPDFGQEGEHDLPFDIPLPSDLPPSLDAPYGSVVYHIAAEAHFVERTPSKPTKRHHHGDKTPPPMLQGLVVQSDELVVQLQRHDAAAADAAKLQRAVWRADKANGTAPASVKVTFPQPVVQIGGDLPVRVRVRPAHAASGAKGLLKVTAPDGRTPPSPRVTSIVCELHQTALYRYLPPGKFMVKRAIVAKTEYTEKDDELQDEATLHLTVPERDTLPTSDAGLFCIAHRVRVIIQFDTPDPKRGGKPHELRLIQHCLLSPLAPLERERLATLASPWELAAAKRSLKRLYAWAERAVALSETDREVADPAWEPRKGAQPEGDADIEPLPRPLREVWTAATLRAPHPGAVPSAHLVQDSPVSVFRVEPLPGRISLVQGFHGLTDLSVVGRVRLELRRPLHARRLTVHVYGEESLDPDPRYPLGSGREGVRRPLVHEHRELWTQRDADGDQGSGTLAGRDQTFAFDVPLPRATHLPASTSHARGRVRYRVMAMLEHADMTMAMGAGTVMHASFPLELVRCLLPRGPAARRAVEWTSDADFEEARGVAFSVRVPARVFAPNDSMVVEVLQARGVRGTGEKKRSRNATPRVVGCRVELVELLTYHYQRPKRMRRVLAVSEVPCHKDQAVTVTMQRPEAAHVTVVHDVGEDEATGRTCRQPHGLIDVAHRLLVRLRVANGADVELSTPVACTSISVAAGVKISDAMSFDQLDAADELVAHSVLCDDAEDDYGGGVAVPEREEGYSDLAGSATS